ncbi:uncharacterized protein [Rutidosis leptorrhynchoides]|uniref:uncharacterized protein n=1 Tax=Rutidosis leptorrhynchoides TaxID=125765 RepID=UPI003A998FC9
MATAQVVSATTALHEEKIEEQTVNKPQEDQINSKNDQETTVTAPQPSEDQNPEPEPEPKSEPEVPEAELEPKSEPEALAAEVETKVVLKENENNIDSVNQPAKVAPEPCVEEESKESKELEAESADDVAKPETETEGEAEKKDEKKEEGGAVEENN